MKQPATRELFNYWNGLRGNRTAPDRAEIDPAAIRGLLADTFMLEIDPERRFPIRLSGSRINALFCAEQKSHAFVDLWSANETRNVAAILLTVADATCPIVAGAAAAPKGYNQLELELLFLPLRLGSRVNVRILGALSGARKPPWLGLLPVESLELRSLQAVGENGALPTGYFPRPPEINPAGGRPGEDFENHGHLRVFRGGRHDGSGLA